jgi:hypothetical protein
MRNTTVSVYDIPNGVVIRVRPNDTEQLHWLRRETAVRSAQLGRPASFGPGAMQLCPNAVAGSRTVVLDAPYGSDVEITADGAASAQAIRDRATRLSRQVVPGRLGDRCPVALPRAILETSEIAGGVRIAVQAAGPGEVDTIRRLVRERAADFEPAKISSAIP